MMVRRVKEALPVDACAVYLLEEESLRYVLTADGGDWLEPGSATPVSGAERPCG